MRFDNPEVESIILRKYRALSELRGATTQKTIVFIVTAVRVPQIQQSWFDSREWRGIFTPPQCSDGLTDLSNLSTALFPVVNRPEL